MIQLLHRIAFSKHIYLKQTFQNSYANTFLILLALAKKLVLLDFFSTIFGFSEMFAWDLSDPLTDFSSEMTIFASFGFGGRSHLELVPLGAGGEVELGEKQKLSEKLGKRNKISGQIDLINSFVLCQKSGQGNAKRWPLNLFTLPREVTQNIDCEQITLHLDCRYP